MAGLAPHPLVVAAAKGLAGVVGGPLKDALAAKRPVTTDEGFASTLADQANLPGLIVVIGYVGAQVPQGAATWRLVYLDARLDSWLLVDESNVVVSQKLTDPDAPMGEYDVLWVNATANIVRGSGPQSNDARFLVGQLTRAGEFAASTAGSSLAASSGLLCEATTPGCCITSRTR